MYEFQTVATSWNPTAKIFWIESKIYVVDTAILFGMIYIMMTKLLFFGYPFMAQKYSRHCCHEEDIHVGS